MFSFFPLGYKNTSGSLGELEMFFSSHKLPPVVSSVANQRTAVDLY